MEKEDNNNYSEEELDDYIELIVSEHSPPPHEARNQILQLLNRRRVQAVCNGDYDYAEVQDKNLRTYFQVIQKEDNKLDKSNQLEMMNLRQDFVM